MITLRLDMRGIVGLRTRVMSAMRKLEQRQPAMEQIKHEQIIRWITNFSTEGGEYGGWAGLSEMTIRERGNSGPILQRSGGLFQDVIAQSDEGRVSPALIDWVFRNRGSGRGDPFPVSHQTGYTSPLTGGPVPARVIWDLDGEDEQRAFEIMEDYVDRIIATHF
jgi:hypothetical protein